MHQFLLGWLLDYSDVLQVNRWNYFFSNQAFKSTIYNQGSPYGKSVKKLYFLWLMCLIL